MSRADYVPIRAAARLDELIRESEAVEALHRAERGFPIYPQHDCLHTARDAEACERALWALETCHAHVSATLTIPGRVAYALLTPYTARLWPLFSAWRDRRRRIVGPPERVRRLAIPAGWQERTP